MKLAHSKDSKTPNKHAYECASIKLSLTVSCDYSEKKWCNHVIYREATWFWVVKLSIWTATWWSGNKEVPPSLLVLSWWEHNMSSLSCLFDISIMFYVSTCPTCPIMTSLMSLYVHNVIFYVSTCPTCHLLCLWMSNKYQFIFYVSTCSIKSSFMYLSTCQTCHLSCLLDTSIFYVSTCPICHIYIVSLHV